MTGKDKRGKSSTFKEFGNFLALNLMKHIIRRPNSSSAASSKSSSKNQGKKDESDIDAIEAGFSSGFHKHKSSNGINGLGKKIADSVSARLANSISTLDGVDFTKLAEMPGVVGLNNHGNTCFVNSVIQCLSNTELIAEYFLLGQYKTDMKHCRKDRSKKYGTRGEVTEQVAVIIKSLWTNSYNKEMTSHLKDLLSKHSAQYKGSNQHDSQEFLLWLFDKMHEDINVTPAKRHPLLRRQSLKKIKSNKSVTMIENGYCSFIEKFFRGFYKSCLSCPSCKKTSETTDPFLSISVPLKQRTTRPIYVNVAYLSSKRRSSSHRNLFGKTLMIGLELPLDGSVEDLRQAVAEKCSIHSRLIAFVDLHYDGFHQSYGDGDPLSKIPFPNAACSNNSSSSSSTTCNSSNSTPTTSNMTLYAFEMPHLHLTSGTLPKNFSSKHRKQRSEFVNTLASETTEVERNICARSSNSLVVILINKQGIGREGMRFGRPVVFRSSRDVDFSELQKIILNYVQPFIKEGVDPDKLEDLFCLQVVDGLPNKSYLSLHAAKPFKLPTVDHALERCPAGSPMHIKLVAEWKPGLGIFDKVPEEKIDVDDSVRLQKVLHHQPLSCTLDECLDLLTQDEKLSADNAWRCPHCYKQQHNAVKKMSMYSLPDIMVIHLKRFKIENNQRTKLNTGVHFPLTGLDMYKRLYKPNNLSTRKTPQDIEDEIQLHDNHIYDLYGVVHHYGSLNSGHYDAACCNTLDGKWYLYDDQRAESIMDTQLSKTNAYILFYQRRTASPALSCASASVNTLTSTHWAYNLPQLKKKFSSHGHINRINVNASTSAPASPKALTAASNTNNNNNSIPTRSNVEKISHAKKTGKHSHSCHSTSTSSSTLQRSSRRHHNCEKERLSSATRGEADGVEALDAKNAAHHASTSVVSSATTSAKNTSRRVSTSVVSSSTTNAKNTGHHVSSAGSSATTSANNSSKTKSEKKSHPRKKVQHHSSQCRHRRGHSEHRRRPYSSSLYDDCDGADERDNDDEDDDGGFDSVRRPYVRGLSRPSYHISPHCCHHSRSSSRTLGDGGHRHNANCVVLKEERERARHYRSYRKQPRQTSQV